MLDVIKKLLIGYVDIPQESITAEMMFFADLQMDSIEVLNMICKIEDELGIEIPTDDLKGIYTVGDLAAYLEEKKAGKK